VAYAMSVNTTNGRRAELRDFLRARRRAVSPESVGLSRGKRRRIAGLRREELAALAGVGVTWYTWLEQGRNIRVSADTLTQIARALGLSPTDRQHLFTLCELYVPEPMAPVASVPTPVLLALASFRGPALVIAPTTDVLATNDFAEALYDFDAFPGPHGRNVMLRGLLDPTRRRFYVNFDETLPNMVGIFRVAHARHAGEQRFEEVLSTLMSGSPEFVRCWNEQQTALPKPVLLEIQSETFGRVNFHSVRFEIPSMPDYLLVLLPPADEATRRIVERWFRRRSRV
jgi:transcriptional regulator with XRE-family HTH domain